MRGIVCQICARHSLTQLDYIVTFLKFDNIWQLTAVPRNLPVLVESTNQNEILIMSSPNVVFKLRCSTCIGTDMQNLVQTPNRIVELIKSVGTQEDSELGWSPHRDPIPTKLHSAIQTMIAQKLQKNLGGE